jgi:Ni,Fe-hydrogenase maturation factor
LVQVEPAECGTQGLATHHLGAPELLALGRELYDSLPKSSLLLTIGAGSTRLGEEFSKTVNAALPEACNLLEKTILRLVRAELRQSAPGE